MNGYTKINDTRRSRQLGYLIDPAGVSSDSRSTQETYVDEKFKNKYELKFRNIKNAVVDLKVI